jgi:hypothetical protein
VYTKRVNKQTNKQTEFLMIITAMNGEYGAPEGRVNKQLETEDLCRAMPIAIFEGYDYGGSYWGAGQALSELAENPILAQRRNSEAHFAV